MIILVVMFCISCDKNIIIGINSCVCVCKITFYMAKTVLNACVLCENLKI